MYSQSRQLSWHGLTAVPFWRRGIVQRKSRPGGEIAVYRQVAFLGSIAIAMLGAAPAAHPESERCQELARRYEIAEPQITATEVSLTLFSAVDGNCIALATELLDHGASVDARDRLGASRSAMLPGPAILRWSICCWRGARRSTRAISPAPPRCICRRGWPCLDRAAADRTRRRRQAGRAQRDFSGCRRRLCRQRRDR